MAGSSSRDRGVKLFVFAARRPRTTLGAFREGWWEEHDRLAAHLAARAGVLRIELYGRLLDDPGAGPGSRPLSNRFDGVAVMWFDGLDIVRDVMAEPLLGRDPTKEALWYGDGDVAWVVTGPPDVIIGPPGGDPTAPVVFFCILRRRPGVAGDAFHEHWLHHHGALFRDTPELRAPLRGYEQNHGLAIPGGDFDGVTQQWFRSLADRDVALSSDAHRELEAPDVASFLDPDGMFYVLTERGPVVVG